MRIMSFDVESVGLHGEGYAVGWVVLKDGVEISSGYAACPSAHAEGTVADRVWIEANIDPHLPDPTHHTPREVRDHFWAAWMSEKVAGAVLAADCAWPVEAGFLKLCIADCPLERNWDGPYPLHDVATARLAAGLGPLATVERLPVEEPKHHPTADARHSARLLIGALTIRGVTR